MSWVKPSLYIIGLLIVVFGGALLLDQTAHIELPPKFRLPKVT